MSPKRIRLARDGNTAATGIVGVGDRDFDRDFDRDLDFGFNDTVAAEATDAAEGGTAIGR
jgi:hypothetical protein